MTLLGNLAQSMANAPSTNAATDRASWRPQEEGQSCALASPSGILASSPSPTGSVQSLQATLLEAKRKNELLMELEKGVDPDGYPFCQYRKGFLGHLSARGLITSTLRVSVTQSTTILASFITDQLDLDLKRNVKVNNGELTQLEADWEADEWEKIEWDRRWKTLPQKLITALLKYHSVTLILRSYEFLASKLVNLKQLDKLTMDPFAMSKRIATKQQDQRNEITNADRLNVTISMTQTTLWANLLPFCADLSLHQGLLCYAYYKYYSYQRQKRLVDTAEFRSEDVEAARSERKALVSDLGTKLSKLAANRGLGWVCSAMGAGVGSVVWPGWGTIVFSALGDAGAGALLDDGYHKAQTSLEEQQRDSETKDAIDKAQVQ